MTEPSPWWTDAEWAAWAKQELQGVPKLEVWSEHQKINVDELLPPQGVICDPYSMRWLRWDGSQYVRCTNQEFVEHVRQQRWGKAR